MRTVVKRLNPIIRGQAAYYRHQVASRTFSDLDHWMYTRIYRYFRYSHPKKSWTWFKTHHGGPLNPRHPDRWVLGDPTTGAYLLPYSWFRIERHTPVKGTASPDDPHLRDYWVDRAKQQFKAQTPKVPSGDCSATRVAVCGLWGKPAQRGRPAAPSPRPAQSGRNGQVG